MTEIAGYVTEIAGYVTEIAGYVTEIAGNVVKISVLLQCTNWCLHTSIIQPCN